MLLKADDDDDDVLLKRAWIDAFLYQREERRNFVICATHQISFFLFFEFFSFFLCFCLFCLLLLLHSRIL